MTKEVAIKKKESFWERNKKSNGLLLKKRAKKRSRTASAAPIGIRFL